MADWVDNGDGTHSFQMSTGERVTIPDAYLTGWGADIQDISHANPTYHEYHVSTSMGINVGEVPDKDVLQAFQSNSTPFTRNFAGPGFVYNVEGFRNEINITSFFHALNPGIVVRELTVVKGQYVIETYGFGQGAFKDLNVSLADSVWKVTDAYVISDLIQGEIDKGQYIWLFQKLDQMEAGARCFPAHTRIQTSRTTSTAISALRVGDVVLAFDARADKGRGALVPRRVTRLYRNTTTDWIRLRWARGTAREVITTPGPQALNAPLANRSRPAILKPRVSSLPRRHRATWPAKPAPVAAESSFPGPFAKTVTSDALGPMWT